MRYLRAVLIECNHCGAPLDVKPNQKTSKCRYCDTTSQVNQNKTLAIQTPPGWRPPQQWVPPAQAAADSAKTLVYHGFRAVRAIVGMVVTLAVLAVVVPIVMFVVMPMIASRAATFGTEAAANPEVQKTLNEAMAQVSQAMQQAGGQIQGANAAAAAAGGPSLLGSEGSAKMLSAFREHFGGSVRAKQLVIHDHHAMLQAQDPKNPAHVDRYIYRGGALGSPEPVRLMSNEKRNLDAVLFDLDDVALERIEELGKIALSELEYDNATVSHVIIDRAAGKPTIRIYARSPRDSGYVRFSAIGKVERAVK